MNIKERNIIIKKWRDNQLRIALIYPNKYSSMSGLTIQMLYNLWNSHPNVICERFFLPDDVVSGKWMRKNKYIREDNRLKRGPGSLYPPLKSLESSMPLSSFDICAFSVCYELNYPNICWILENAGIPYVRNERILQREQKKDENIYVEIPLIITGGPAIRSNPLPLGNIVDLAYIGEIEPSNDDFIRTWFTWRESNESQNEVQGFNTLIKAFSTIRGFWAPQLGKYPVERVYIANLDQSPHPITQIIPEVDVEVENIPFGKAIYIEVNRGCNFSCKFCMTGSQLKPFRNRSFEQLKEIIQSALEINKVSKIVLIGSSILDHPRFEELCEFLIEKEVEFSVPSVRAERITEKIASLLKKSGMKTIAIAPEAGNDELRKRLNKKTTNAQIINTCKLLLNAGIPNIKLYMIYGFPFETDDDARSISSFCRQIADLGYGRDAVRLSLNPFIPKAHTPFEAKIEYYQSPKMDKLRKREKIILESLKGNIQVRTQTLAIEESYIQTLFSLADSSISDFLMQCYKKGMNARKWFKLVNKKENQDILCNLILDIKKNYEMKKEQSWSFIKIR